MDLASFGTNSPGRLVSIPGGHSAFVPHPLPPPMQFGGRVLLLSDRAMLSLGRLDGKAQTLPNPHMLIRVFQQQEALLSSRIEGTIADPQELLLAEVSRGAPPSSGVREVRNYMDALDRGLRQLQELPVSLRLIRDAHRRLMRGVRGQEQRPGEFRDIQNYIGKPGGFSNARFVPPPVAEMRECLDAFEKFLHSEDDLPALVRLAFIHYQFEAIHPFRDGNGRIGRLLLVILLCDWKLLSHPLIYLSGYFDKHRDAYLDHLLAVSQRGAWEEWLRFFLQAVDEQAREAFERATSLLALREQYRERLQALRASSAALRLVDALFVRPILTVPVARGLLKMTYRGAQQVLLKLERAKIITEWRRVSGGRPKAFFAEEIIRLTSAL